MYRAAVLGLLLLLGCGRNDKERPPGSAACGLAMVAGPTALLSQFSVPRQTLGTAPRRLPERLVVRMVAGPAYPAIVGRTDSLWLIGMEGAVPENVKPGFGVLVMDQDGEARGVLLYEGIPVEGAPSIGQVSVGNTSVPLIGIELNPTKIEDPRCPFFPDTVIK